MHPFSQYNFAASLILAQYNNLSVENKKVSVSTINKSRNDRIICVPDFKKQGQLGLHSWGSTVCSKNISITPYTTGYKTLTGVFTAKNVHETGVLSHAMS